MRVTAGDVAEKIRQRMDANPAIGERDVEDLPEDLEQVLQTLLEDLTRDPETTAQQLGDIVLSGLRQWFPDQDPPAAVAAQPATVVFQLVTPWWVLSQTSRDTRELATLLQSSIAGLARGLQHHKGENWDRLQFQTVSVDVGPSDLDIHFLVVASRTEPAALDS